PTGYAVLDAMNVDQPEFARFIYTDNPGETAARFDSSVNVAFVPGVNPDPFYITMSRGVNAAAARYGATVIQQDPERFDPTVQTPIIQALVARGDIAVLITAATDKEQMVPVLQSVADAGIPVISVDTFIGDGDYAAGPVTFPLSYIGSDNVQGGFIACAGRKPGCRGEDLYLQRQPRHFHHRPA
nr:substrate-binding domain-containing protein [Anaerolineae bacterium]